MVNAQHLGETVVIRSSANCAPRRGRLVMISEEEAIAGVQLWRTVVHAPEHSFYVEVPLASVFND